MSISPKSRRFSDNRSRTSKHQSTYPVLCLSWYTSIFSNNILNGVYYNIGNLFFNDEYYEMLYRYDVYIYNYKSNINLMIGLVGMFIISLINNIYNYSIINDDLKYSYRNAIVYDCIGLFISICYYGITYLGDIYKLYFQNLYSILYILLSLLLIFSNILLKNTINSALILCCFIILYSMNILLFPLFILSNILILSVYIIFIFTFINSSNDYIMVLIQVLSVILTVALLTYSTYKNEIIRRRAFIFKKRTEDEKLKLSKDKKQLQEEVYNLIMEKFDIADMEKDVLDLKAPIERATELLQDLIAPLNSLSSAQQSKVENVLELLGSGDIFRPQIFSQLDKGSSLDSEMQVWLRSLVPDDRHRTSNHDSIQIITSDAIDLRMQLPNMIDDEETKFLKVLDTIDDYNFDVFELKRLTKGVPLLLVSLALFRKYNLFSKFTISLTKLKSWITAIESGYHEENPYHNATHAADVTQTCHYFILKGNLKQKMTDIEILSALIACIIHDFDHPGRTNAFHIAMKDKKAIIYNDKSVLENHHAAASFMLMNKPENNFLEVLPLKEYNECRKVVVDMVLATDLTQHFDFINQFKTMVTTGGEHKDYMADSKDKMMVLKMAIKCSDVSHTSKSENLHHLWTQRIIEEFYLQGDEESKNNMLISPFMDRYKANVPKAQTGFIEFLVKPMYEIWVHFLKIDPIQMPCYDQLLVNREFWRNEEKQGVLTHNRPVIINKSIEVLLSKQTK